MIQIQQEEQMPNFVLALSLSVRELVKLQREVMSAETALEQKRMARHNLLLACKIHSLPITLLSGNLSEISEVQVGQREVSFHSWLFFVSSELPFQQ